MSIKIETWCPHCGKEENFEHDYEAPFECKECGHKLYRDTYTICEGCGERVYLRSNTNECQCGAYYNGFGQRLADPREWDEQDHYDCFGPQDYMDQIG